MAVEPALVADARAGSETAFGALCERHRRELLVHAYRILGSIHDAEDAVQETFLRAWRGLNRFEGRSSFRRWLYRIATTTCCDLLAGRPRRVLPHEIVPAADPLVPPAPPADLPWLTPFPDALLPEDVVVAKETIELAFIAAIQQLPPRQRAVLMLRDVLGWSAKETADTLATSVAAANSALQRARAAVAAERIEREASGDERRVVRRYMQAWEKADVAALVELLCEDARMTMPPTVSWYDGRAAIGTYLENLVFAERGPGPLRLVPIGANRQPALAVYSVNGPFALKVLTISGNQICAISGFVDPALFALFGLSD